MADATTRRERQDAALAELSELGLTLARDLHARALAAQTPAEAERLALAFQRVSRGVRQTFALELKIERDRREAEREDRDRDHRAAVARKSEHRSRVRAAVERLIWTEAEDEYEAGELSEDLDALLEEAALAEDFADIPLETLVERLRADLGLGRPAPVTQPPPEPEPSTLAAAAAPPNTG